MMNEKTVADNNMLKITLQKSEDMIKGLKGEKEYYVKQVECLRKELEQIKTAS